MPKENSPKDGSNKLSETELLNFLKELSGHADREISRVSMMYKFIATLLSLIVIVGIWFTHKDASEYRQEARDEVKRVHEDITEQKKEIKENMERQEHQMHERQNTLFSQMQSRLSDRVENLGNEVKYKVDEQFKSENITELVNKVAKDKIETVAVPVINNELYNTILPKIDGINDNVNQLKADIVNSHDIVKELNKDAEYINVVISAQSDSRKSFDILIGWASDSKYYRQLDAISACRNIIDTHDLSPQLDYHMHLRDGREKSKLSFEDLRKEYYGESLFDERAAILQYVWQRKDFSPKQKMELVVEAMRTDPSLNVVTVASRLFMSKSKQQYKPLPVKNKLEWWEKNKDKISDKL